MALTNILDLPAEMRLQILSSLPVGDIANARLLSKSHKDLIDNPENQKLLWDPVEARELARILASVEHIFGYDKSTVSFMQALQRFLAHRGIRSNFKDENTGLYHLLPFAILYTFGPKQEHTMYTDPRNPTYAWWQAHPRAYGALCCAMDLVQVQVTSRMPTSKNLCGYMNKCEDEFVYARYHRQSFHENELKAMYRRVRNSHRGVFKGKVIKGDDYRQALPEYPLTMLLHPQTVDDSTAPRVAREKIQRQNGICSISKVKELFPGVASIPEGYYFAYCVESEWAYDIVKDIVSGGRVLNRAVYLAVLEELYVY